MKNVIGILVMLMLSFSWSSSMAFDIESLKIRFADNVATPYGYAIEFLAYYIIGDLADKPVPETVSESDVEMLKNDIYEFYDQLKSAATALDQLVNETNIAHEGLVANHSKVEQELDRVEKNLTSTESKLNGTLDSIELTLTKLFNTTKHLNSMYQSVKDEAAEIKKLRNCIISRRRRKRNFWKDSINSLCFVHDPEIENRIYKLNLTAMEYRPVYNSYLDLLVVKWQLIHDYEDLTAKKAYLDDDKWMLEIKLEQMENLRNQVANISTSFKGVLSHIDALLGKGYVLKTTVEDLIDMNTLIIPLEDISVKIQEYVGDEYFDFYYVKGLQSYIASCVEKIKKKLPDYPLILPDDY